MTYLEMKDWFTILQDKYGSPYHTDDEIALFLNRAQIDEVSGLLPIDGGAINIEANQNVYARLSTLIKTNTTTTMDLSGSVDKGTLEFNMGTKIFRLLAASYNDYPVKWTRYNNLATYQKNTFKIPTPTTPRMYEDALLWKFLPVNTGAILRLTVLCIPITMLADGSVNCQLPDITHNDIVARALSYAGVGSRDQMLTELKRANNV